MKPWNLLLIGALFGCAETSSCTDSADPTPTHPVQHIIVISLENHSFDNLFGTFPLADGFASSHAFNAQTDEHGTPYVTLPAVMDTRAKPPAPDARFPASLPNQPFPIEQYVGADTETGDLVHRFQQEQEQIHHGKMDRFAAVSDAGGLTMGYYDGSTLGLWQYAQKYTLADHFFHAAFGGSFLNHFWLICACTPRYENAPEALVKSGAVTEDGYAVNTLFPTYTPHPAGMNDPSKLLPPQDALTIGDRLSEKHISWAWYAGGWNAALAGNAHPSFQFHHQPFVYFSAFQDDSNAKTQHLKDENDFLADLEKGTLPAVAFYKPLGEFNLHPGYANVASGDAHIRDLLQKIEQSPQWKNTVVIVTFDENGGYWDHVAPPTIDRFGPGTRVPTIIISPFAKKGFVDHTVYDTTSILKFIEWRYGLAPLGTRDGSATNLTNALELPPTN